jgi:hypothetical protein
MALVFGEGLRLNRMSLDRAAENKYIDFVIKIKRFRYLFPFPLVICCIIKSSSKKKACRTCTGSHASEIYCCHPKYLPLS